MQAHVFVRSVTSPQSVSWEQGEELWRASAVHQSWQKRRDLCCASHMLKLETLPKPLSVAGRKLACLWNLCHFFRGGSHVTVMSSASQTACFSWATEDLSGQDRGETSWPWGKSWPLCQYKTQMGVWDSFSQAFLLLTLGVCLGLELVFAWQWPFYFVLTRSASITKCRWMKTQGEGQVRCTVPLANPLHLYL